MHKTINGYTVSFDTQKRAKYSDETKNKIVDMKKNGYSRRDTNISKTL